MRISAVRRNFWLHKKFLAPCGTSGNLPQYPVGLSTVKDTENYIIIIQRIFGFRTASQENDMVELEISKKIPDLT